MTTIATATTTATTTTSMMTAMQPSAASTVDGSNDADGIAMTQQQQQQLSSYQDVYSAVTPHSNSYSTKTPKHPDSLLPKQTKKNNNNNKPPPTPDRTPQSSATSDHPDFMYCGECTDNNNNINPQQQQQQQDRFVQMTSQGFMIPVQDEDGKNNSSDSNSSDIDMLTKSSQAAAAATTTITMLQQSRLILHPNPSSWIAMAVTRQQHQLLLTSLLLPMPGVHKVMVELDNITDESDNDDKEESNNFKNTVTILHDASFRATDFVRVLKQGGYPSMDSSCCPPPPSSSSSADHTPTNSVPDPATTPSSDIISNSTNNGTNTNGGHHRNVMATEAAAVLLLVKSTLFAPGICCASEVPSIRKILRPLPGVASLQINITTKRVYVQHEPALISAIQMIHVLTQQGFPAHIVHDGAATAATTTTMAATSNRESYPNALQQLQQLPKSNFVESTFFILNFTSRHAPVLTRAISQTFIKSKVRAVHPHVTSKIVKVEHNPSLVSCEAICHALSKYGLDASVVTDGAQANLVLPLVDNEGVTLGNTQEDLQKQRASEEEWQSTKLSLHVALSGVFWVLSLVAAIRGWPTILFFSGLASVLLGLPPVAIKAWRTAFQRCEFDANCMMVTAAIGALALQEWDEAASVSFLFAISEYLEARATDKARTALAAICHLRPDFAHLVHPETGEIVVVPADRVPVGSLISVRTGDKIAADGIVVEGVSQIDESSLTGESVPVRKTINDTVSGGGINIGSTQLVIRTTTSADDSAVNRLIRLVEEAQANTSPTEKMIDAFARAYTPAVLAIATILCTIPWFWGAEVGRNWTLNGLIIIVIACPCALTISTPVTYAAGLAATAQRGIVVKGGASLESLGGVKTVLLDKTGTLTEGKFQIKHLQEINVNRKEMLELLALMEAPSSHPLSATLVQAAKNEGVAISSSKKKVLEHSILKGEGVTARIDEKQVFVGNARLFERVGMYKDLPEKFHDRVQEWNQTGGSVGFIGVEGIGIVGTFCVTDIVRPESREVVEGLLLQGIDVHMLTGDCEGAALSVAAQIGLPRDRVHAKLLPEDKLHYVGSMKDPATRTNQKSYSCGLFRRASRILFCGDGVNDAPALAVADVGVSMGEGASLAMEMSDVTLMDSNLYKLVYVLKMGSRVVQTIRENIIMSLACKLVVVALTFLGYMTLLFAIASDVGVMLLVTLNGMKLLPGDMDGGLTALDSSKRLLRQDQYREVALGEDCTYLVDANRTNTAVAEHNCDDGPLV